MNDTVLVALELDLTSTESYHHTGTGEASELPAPPIMYAYVSDGTLLGWYIVNSQGKAYSGMVSARAEIPAVIAPAMSTSISQKDMHMSTAPVTPVSEPVNAFGQQTSSQPAFGHSIFSQSLFLQPQSSTSTFGQSSTPPTFGQTSASRQPSQPSSVFGQPSAFGQAASTSPLDQTSTSPAFGLSAPSGGFGAFSSAGPARFGQAASGFGTFPSPKQPASSPPPAPSAPAEDSMTSDDGPPFATMSLGVESLPDSKQSPTFGSGSIFGQVALSPPPNTDDEQTYSFGSGAIKPATGFGAFSSLNSQPNAFGNAAIQDVVTPEALKPASAFGKSGFEIKASTSFGQSGFGMPVFGQSGFGQTSSFGKPNFGASITQPTSAGFGAFPPGGPSPFATTTSQAKEGTKPVQPTSGGFGAFAQNGPSGFAQVAPTGSEDSKPGWASGGSQGAYGAMQYSSDTKSIFSDASNSGNALGELASSEDKSAFSGGKSLDGSSAFTSGQSVFDSQPVKDEAKDVEVPSTPKPMTPAIAPASLPLSHESTPFRSDDTGSPSPFGQNDNVSSVASPFKSSSPASGTGAFGQLKSSSTGFFKPAEGFGAFGFNINKDSPFYNPPKEVGTKPVSVFASSSEPLTPTNTLPKSDSTTSVFGSQSVHCSSKPAFGSTSALGSTTKPLFGSPSSPLLAIHEPTSGGFSAFSNKSPFGTLTGAKTLSFGDLLRGSEDVKDPSKSMKSLFGAPAEADAKPAQSVGSTHEATTLSSVFQTGGAKDSTISVSASNKQDQTESSSSAAPVELQKAPSAKPASALTSPALDETKHDCEEANESKLPGKNKDTVEPPPVSKPALIQTSSKLDKTTQDLEQVEQSTTQGRDEYASELRLVSSLSQSSSFVRLPAASDEEDSTSRVDNTDIPTDSGSDLEDDTQSFLSESFSSEGPDEEPSDEEVSDEEGRSRSQSPEDSADATEVPLLSIPEVKTRSPSTTPKPESSRVKLAKSLSPPTTPSASATEKLTNPARPIRGGSTTPPGSPPQEEYSAIFPDASAQVPVAPTPIGLGLGRPSTRPVRSSPLASAAPLAPSIDEAQTSKSAPSIVPKPASPKQPFGVLGTVPIQNLPLSGTPADDGPRQSKRSATPPLLSAGITSAKLPSFSGYVLTSKSSPSLLSNISDKPARSSSPPKLLDVKPSTSSANALDTPFSPQPPNLFRKSTAPSSLTLPAQASPFGGPLPGTPAPSSSIPSLFDSKAIPVLHTDFYGAKVPAAPSSTPPPNVHFTNLSGEVFGGFVGAQSQGATASVGTPTSPAELQGQGMQAQCALLCTHLTRELDNVSYMWDEEEHYTQPWIQLRQHAQRTKAMRGQLSRASGMSHHKDNLIDPIHWTLGDMKTWGQVLKTFQSDIEQLQENRRSLSQSLRELESSMLRGKLF
jgi:nucleoporin NUP159